MYHSIHMSNTCAGLLRHHPSRAVNPHMAPISMRSPIIIFIYKISMQKGARYVQARSFLQRRPYLPLQ
jgi:hypothetical protein